MKTLSSTLNILLTGLLFMSQVADKASSYLAWWFTGSHLPKIGSWIFEYGNTWVAPLVPWAFGSAIVIRLVWPLVRRYVQSNRSVLEAPARDIEIHRVVDYIVNDSNTPLRDKPVGYDDELVSKLNWRGEQHHDAIERVRQNLIIGELKAWGYIQIGESSAMLFDSAFQEIPASYWQGANFRNLFCFDHLSQYPQTYRIDGDKEGPIYKNVALNRVQVETVWPRKAIWKRLIDKLTRRERLTYWTKYPAQTAKMAEMKKLRAVGR